VHKPAHKILKPLKLKGPVSERNHAGTRKQDETFVLAIVYLL
jgi:hypothetical protein